MISVATSLSGSAFPVLPEISLFTATTVSRPPPTRLLAPLSFSRSQTPSPVLARMATPLMKILTFPRNLLQTRMSLHLLSQSVEIRTKHTQTPTSSSSNNTHQDRCLALLEGNRFSSSSIVTIVNMSLINLMHHDQLVEVGGKLHTTLPHIKTKSYSRQRSAAFVLCHCFFRISTPTDLHFFPTTLIIVRLFLHLLPLSNQVGL